MDRFVQLSATEGHAFRRREPFLKRHLPEQVPNEAPNDIITHSGLELKICVNTYRITWVQNTEDYFHHKRGKRASHAVVTGRAVRNKRFSAWQSGEGVQGAFSQEQAEDVRDLFLGRGKYGVEGVSTVEDTKDDERLGGWTRHA